MSTVMLYHGQNVAYAMWNGWNEGNGEDHRGISFDDECHARGVGERDDVRVRVDCDVGHGAEDVNGHRFWIYKSQCNECIDRCIMDRVTELTTTEHVYGHREVQNDQTWNRDIDAFGVVEVPVHNSMLWVCRLQYIQSYVVSIADSVIFIHR